MKTFLDGKDLRIANMKKVRKYFDKFNIVGMCINEN
jgi:hypothetical protein